MKVLTTAVLLGSLAALPSVALAQAQPQGKPAATTEAKARILKRAEFDALLAQPSKVLVLDVRRPDEIQTIGGFATYLSIQAGDLEKHLDAIPKDRLIIAVSNHAARGGRAASLLEKHGFKVAGAIGAQNYEEEGGTLVKIAPPKPAADKKD